MRWTVAFIILALLTASPPVMFAGTSSSITGTVIYRERIALPSDATVIVRLWDVTRRDDWQLLGKQVLKPAGQLPIRFTVDYNPVRIRPDGDYVVEARILVAGQLRWINSRACPVLTKGYQGAVTVIVRVFTVGAQDVAVSAGPNRDCQYTTR